MKRDSRLSSVLHALLHMAAHDRPMTSDTLAACMGANPVVVRRTMAGLREAGFVRSGKGHNGGWTIACDLSTVSLRDIHQALGEPAIFAIGNRNETPECLVEQSVNAALDDAFAAAEDLLMQRFGSVTLAALAEDFSHRLAARRHKKDLPHVI
ncbi:MAG: Rrf2 family transcriptional regulator [Chelatococcus sp.]|jgi:DNA-binding IscR family transcriptional regulator|uniref:Rrf2 family transcriptional regulator n=1 Tax=unclassified Chelatococcus TaxID=2638111 RepID=UPI001BCEFB7B|nr:MULTISPECIES: Rrf2 family transcriptional regulator [unclassified Chelatococcus]CAH1668924.1 Transcriptional regulator [Hyphomicrobiales bacterium]MBS7739400.1 Rrf2 family transcriptional regulator [Chelatococcus sp. HY11]MBX3536541.1 Rrf2 family transcriptional regulator [Chelatococcus sp.]MBX3543769.1 Rrf2 family transcriptional regulator [Chelatococcus sp.]MCO5076065.1 Rrf2 family transcriptional regulator [Chelatococcus sp.]